MGSKFNGLRLILRDGSPILLRMRSDIGFVSGLTPLLAQRGFVSGNLSLLFHGKRKWSALPCVQIDDKIRLTLLQYWRLTGFIRLA